MALKIFTEPASEPVTTAEAKLHLRVDHSSEDAAIGTWIMTAREKVEMDTRRALITQTWDLTLDEWPEEDFIEAPFPPLASVTSITYIDDEGVSHTFANTNYIVDAQSAPGRIVLEDGSAWPADSLRSANGITVRFVCGYGAAGSSVPASLRSAMLLLIGHYYENREATSQNVYQLPMGYEALIRDYKIYTF